MSKNNQQSVPSSRQTKSNLTKAFNLEIRRRIENAKGPRSKELLLTLSQYESPGNTCYGIYECPIVPQRGEGAEIWDIDGNRYIDCLSGFSIANIGHSNASVLNALQVQLSKIPQYAEMPTQIRLEFVARLVRLFPGDSKAKCLLTVTGSEAVEVAVKLARWYTDRPFILSPYGDYHGITPGTIAFTPRASLWEYFSAGTVNQPVGYFHYPYCLRCPYSKTYPSCDFYCIKSLDQLLCSGMSPYYDPHSDRCAVAAILIEPMQGSSGYIVPPNGYLSELRTMCNKFGILLIVDEIQAGLGRTGKIWSCEHSQIEPDLLTTGKSLGGGVPLSAVLGRAEILDSWGLIAHGSTFGGFALGCAGGLAVLNIIEDEGFLNEVTRKGQRFRRNLREGFERHSILASVEGKGLFIGIEFLREGEEHAPDPVTALSVRDLGLERGLICELSGPYQNRINLIPPLIIADQLIDEAVSIIVDCAYISSRGTHDNKHRRT